MVVLAGALLLVSSGCARRVGPGVSGVVERGATDPGLSADAPLELTYLGTGGWIFRVGEEAVLAAPLFSNPSVIDVGLTAIAPDTAVIEEWMSRYDVTGTRAVLVGHGHYDHAMDVPYIARRYVPDARIVASRTVENLFGTWAGLEGRIDLAGSHVADQETPGSWMSYGPRIRVLPLLANHAPHFDGRELYDGTADRPRSEQPRTAAEWLSGVTYAFLVDFLDDRGGIVYRIYYQDAVTAPPLGFAPDALIAERPVDVAIFIPATFDQVDWHPEAFVENLQPERVLLGHWEDFFVPLESETRSILMADIEHFEARLQGVYDGEFWRPEIGTVFRFGPER